MPISQRPTSKEWSKVPVWLLPWAKTDVSGKSRERGGPAWNPALAHFLDVGAVAGELWDRFLPPFTRDRLAQSWGHGDPDPARRVVMALAALHDLGKNSVCFLRQFGTSHRDDDELKQAGKEWEEAARAAGLPLPDNMNAAPYARHEHVSAEVFPRLLGCTCPRCGGSGPYEATARGLHAAALVLGGHHGHIPTTGTVQKAYGAIDPRHTGDWEPIMQAHIDCVLNTVGLDRDTFTAALRPVRPSAVPLLLGLTVTADWIASDEDRFCYRLLSEPVERWWRQSQQEAHEAVTALRLESWDPAPADWADLFPHTPSPRPFQQTGLDLLPAEGPVMMIVESDTGSGKTKLALACAHHVAQVTGAHGIYQAMPTKASGTQVAGVFRQFLKTALCAGTAANLALAHSSANAVTFTHELMDEADKGTAAAQQDAALDDLAAYIAPILASVADREPAVEGRAVMDPWFLRRCLGLISPFGVGTVDQIALASQKSSHWFLRLFGLSMKTVVIDEAHAYELYQQHLLGAAVAWLGDAGASVIVLSATLPARILKDLTAAWCRGHQVQPTEPDGQGPITVIDHTGTVRCAAPTEAVPALHTAVELRKDPGEDALAAEIADMAEAGGIIGVLKTRVDPAVSLYEKIAAAAAERGWEKDTVVLLHGRLLPWDRLPVEDTLTELLGPNPADPATPNPRRPHRLIVVATQVIEQSLDIDFDHLVTDLAPVDLLIQRRGRVHRHTANDPHRPTWCWHHHAPHREPQLRMPPMPRMPVLWTADTDGLPVVEKPTQGSRPGTADAFVYAPYPLAVTWAELARRTGPDNTAVLTTPVDSSDLLEAVYGDQPTADGTLGALLTRTWEAWQADLTNETQEAHERVLWPYDSDDGAPTQLTALASGIDHGDGEDPTKGLRGLRAMPRLGEESVDTIFLYRQPTGVHTYDPEGKMPVDLRYRGKQRTPNEKAAYRRQQIRFSRRTLGIPHRWFQGRRALPQPPEWPVLDHPPTRRLNVAVLDPDGRCVRGPVGLVYDPITGLKRVG